MKMPNVQRCDVVDCAYNTDSRCHAFAITVGGPTPCCDTFTDSSRKGGLPKASGNVGACKVMGCQHNDKLGCMADGIMVSRQSCNADCMTFKSRKDMGEGYV